MRNIHGTYRNGRHFLGAEASFDVGEGGIILPGVGGAANDTLGNGYEGGAYSSFLISTNASGERQAATLLSPADGQADQRVALLSLGVDDTAVYALGTYESAIDSASLLIDGVPTGLRADINERETFVAKFDAATLALEWIQEIGSAGDTAFNFNGRSLTIMPSGWIIGVGSQVGNLALGADTLSVGPDFTGVIFGIRQPLGLPVGLSEAPSGIENLSLYPNPASGAVTVRSRLAQPAAANVSLRNALGQEVYRTTSAVATEHRLRIRTEGLAPGLYFVTVAVGSQQRTERLIVR